MAWFKVDDRLPTSRKLIRIPRSKRAAAVGLWTLAGAWSAHDLTDGFVPAYMIEEWGADEAHAAALVEAGMWERSERDGDDGYMFGPINPNDPNGGMGGGYGPPPVAGPPAPGQPGSYSILGDAFGSRQLATATIDIPAGRY